MGVVKIAVIGGSGLLARHIWHQLAIDTRLSVSIVSRNRPEDCPAHVDFYECDVTQGAALIAETLRGFDVVVNASSYVGPDQERQRVVNDHAASAIARIIERMKATSLIHVSTAGVYGALPFQGGSETDYELAPESPLSLTRAAGEQAALRSGAVVLRPLFVTGVGDEHFLLPLLRAHLAMGAWIEEGKARLSTVSADFVGRVVRALCLEVDTDHGGDVVHVVQEPIRTRELLAPVLTRIKVSLQDSISVDEATDRLARFGVPPRKVQQFSSDYFLSSMVVNRLLGTESVDELPPITATASDWYVERMTA